jgi:hypothetical protein
MSREQQLQEIMDARIHLWKVLDALDDNTEIYTGWTKHAIFAHIAGWEALVFDVFHAHLFKHEPAEHHYSGADNMNIRFIASRSSASLHDIRLECEINRYAILTMVQQIADFSEEVRFPWGLNTVAEFVDSAIEHELSHAADIVRLLRND